MIDASRLGTRSGRMRPIVSATIAADVDNLKI